MTTHPTTNGWFLANFPKEAMRYLKQTMYCSSYVVINYSMIKPGAVQNVWSRMKNYTHVTKLLPARIVKLNKITKWREQTTKTSRRTLAEVRTWGRKQIGFRIFQQITQLQDTLLINYLISVVC